MTSLRTPQALRLLRAATSQPLQVAGRRYESSSIVKAKQPQNEAPAPPEPSQGAVGHNQPDYGAHIDKATSYALSRLYLPALARDSAETC